LSFIAKSYVSFFVAMMNSNEYWTCFTRTKFLSFENKQKINFFIFLFRWEYCAFPGSAQGGMVREEVILGVIPTCGDITLFFLLSFLDIYIYFSLTRIFHNSHFPHSAFSTLRIFYTSHFPHSAFSTLRVFHTPHSALCTPRFPLNQYKQVLTATRQK